MNYVNARLIKNCLHSLFGYIKRKYKYNKSNAMQLEYLMSRSSHDGGEHGSGGIITSKPGLAHTGTIVDNKCSNVVLTHFSGFGMRENL